MRIQVNVYEYRQRKRYDEIVVLVPDEDLLGLNKEGFSPSAADEVKQREISHMIKEIISSCLSKQEKAVVIHIFYEGYTQEETAEIMGIKQSTVSIYFKRELHNLKGKLHNCDFQLLLIATNFEICAVFCL